MTSEIAGPVTTSDQPSRATSALGRTWSTSSEMTPQMAGGNVVTTRMRTIVASACSAEYARLVRIVTPTNSYVPSEPGAAGMASDSATPLRNRTASTGPSDTPTERATVHETIVAVLVTANVRSTTVAAPRADRSAPAPAATRATIAATRSIRALPPFASFVSANHATTR